MQLEMSRAELIKQCDAKIARRHLKAKQREICEKEKLLHAQKLIDLKQREIEVTNRLAAELSLRKNEEIKRGIKLSRAKSFPQSLSDCALKEARSRLIEKKVNFEASQAKLIQLLHQDKTVEKLQQAEQEKKKRNLRTDLQRQIMNNHRRMEEKRNKEKELDRKMIEQTMQKIQEEDARIKKKKANDMILLRKELTASLAAKDAWEKKYKKALKDEDEKISRTVAEKEARQEKLLDMKTEFREMKEAAIDKVAKKLLDNMCKKRRND
ncbi:meiosis-specific nuclear structural protein 1-like [Cataglyphis hispanica]|uniref:meiosis-specific nuclear structural protein 1-like n=1 Tax=Cataglyphis hispanica TaxID=1086592 RepID=UPI00217F3184|nr:meiosis-specific nuclear structural protein 1-like [Cataglyphis hispanica]